MAKRARGKGGRGYSVSIEEYARFCEGLHALADVGEACLKRAKSQRFTSIPASNWESALLGFTYVKNFIEGTAGSAEMLPFAEKIGPLVDQFLELKEERASYSTTKRKEPK